MLNDIMALKFKLHLILKGILSKWGQVNSEMFSAWDTLHIWRDSLSLTSSIGFIEDQKVSLRGTSDHTKTKQHQLFYT